VRRNAATFQEDACRDSALVIAIRNPKVSQKLLETRNLVWAQPLARLCPETCQPPTQIHKSAPSLSQQRLRHGPLPVNLSAGCFGATHGCPKPARTYFLTIEERLMKVVGGWSGLHWQPYSKSVAQGQIWRAVDNPLFGMRVART